MRSRFQRLYRRGLSYFHFVDVGMLRALRFVRKHWPAFVVWGVGCFFVLGGLAALWAASLRIPDLSAIEERKVEQSLKIYDSTGSVLLQDWHEEKRRTIVPLFQISTHIQQATVAIEDAEFYTHKGVRPLAIVRAILANFIAGDLLGGQGGSTITQQVVKGSILTFDKSIARKLKEWILALKLETVLGKSQILELYLNQVPYGGTLYGVEEASQAFFNKHAADVTLPEAAYLAAILPAPTYYSPYGNNKEVLDARKNLVLQKMLEHGYIDDGAYAEAREASVEFFSPRKASIIAPHFVFYVRQLLEEKYGNDVLEQGGWRVTTTLDAELQEKAEQVEHDGALANTEKF